MKVLIICVLLYTLPFYLLADETNEIEEDLLSVYGDEDIISIATGYRKPLAKAPAVASVITAKDLLAMGVTDLDEALETVPGVHVARDPLVYNPIYTFRGIYADFNPQVLMLINGIPITNLFYGNRNLIWGGMPVEAISRIEVIRGPGSAIYGADAFAGVINIITKQGSEIDGINAGARYGSFNTVHAWSQIGGENNGLQYAFSLEYENTDGQDSIIDADAQTFLDLIAGTNVSLAPGQVNLARESYEFRMDLSYDLWRLQTGVQHREAQIGAGAAYALDPHSLSQSTRINSTLAYENPEFMGSNWNVSVKGSFFSADQDVKDDLILFPPGSTGPFFDALGNPIFVDGGGNILTFPNGMIGNPEVAERHYRLDAAGLYLFSSGHELRVGAGYYLGDLYEVKESKNFGVDPSTGLPLFPGSPVVDVSDTPLVFLPEDDRDNYYAFAQGVFQLANDWELTAGMRFDDYSDFGGTFNPRLALVWSAGYNLTTKLLYGEAFRAPSFAQTRADKNPSFLGNPDLDPEELKSYELAFDYRPDENLQFHLNLFQYEWDDIIVFVPDMGGSTRTAQNAGKQKGHGLEFESAWHVLETLELSGNFAWVDTTDENTNTPGGNVPEKQLYVRANWMLADGWSLDVRGNWIANRQRTVADSRPPIDNYFLLDSTLRFAPVRQVWEVALIVKNLLDEDAREPSPAGMPVAIPNDLPLPGRTVLGELRFRFR